MQSTPQLKSGLKTLCRILSYKAITPKHCSNLQKRERTPCIFHQQHHATRQGASLPSLSLYYPQPAMEHTCSMLKKVLRDEQKAITVLKLGQNTRPPWQPTEPRQSDLNVHWPRSVKQRPYIHRPLKHIDFFLKGSYNFHKGAQVSTFFASR